MSGRRPLDPVVLFTRLALFALLLGVFLFGNADTVRNPRIVLLAALLLVQIATAVFSPSSRGPYLRAEMLGSSVMAIAHGTQLVLRRNEAMQYIEVMAGGPISLIFVLGLVAATIGLGMNTYVFFRARESGPNES
jgi:hypothetical protein